MPGLPTAWAMTQGDAFTLTYSFRSLLGSKGGVAGVQEVKGATGDGARAAAGVSEEAALTLRSANASRIPIDEIPAPIYLFDPETLDILAVNAAIVISNRTIESMLGYSRQDLVGQPVDRLLPERYRGRHFLDRVRWLVDRGATFHFSFTGRATSQYSQRRIDG